MAAPSPAAKRFWSAEGDDIVLAVRLTPNGGRDEIGAVTRLADGREVLAVRVRAVPEKGRANAALEKLIARAVGVAPGLVSVARGQKDRVKSVRLTGAAGLAAAVAALPRKE